MKSSVAKLKLDVSTLGINPSKTSVDKLLIKTLHDTHPDIPVEIQLTPILEGFIYFSGSMQGHELLETLLKLLRTHQSRLGVLKALFIIHHVLHIYGEDFSRIFLQSFYTNAVATLQSGSNKDEYLYGVFAVSYYNLLVGYANYYQDIQEFSKLNQEVILKQLQQGDYQSLVQLLTYKNILKYFLYIKDSMQGPIKSLKYNMLAERAVTRTLLDFLQIYYMMTATISHQIKYIFTLNEDIAIMLDELYCDTIQITKKLKSFIENLSFRIHQQLPEIIYYEMDAEFNQKEELYMISLKKGQTKTEADEPEYINHMDIYQRFRVGSKEYRLTSDLSTYGKHLNSPEKSLMKSNTISSSNSGKSSLLSGILSPRVEKKIEFQKSMTSPQITKINIDTNLTSPKALRSTRNGNMYSQVQRDNGYGLFSARTEPGIVGSADFSSRNENIGQAPKLDSMSKPMWSSQRPLSARLNEDSADARDRLNSSGKTKFSSLFGRKSRVNSKISPFLTEES